MAVYYMPLKAAVKVGIDESWISCVEERPIHLIAYQRRIFMI